MFDDEEKEVLKLKESINSAAKPNNIEDYIKEGINSGIKKKKNIMMKRYLSAAVLVFVLVFSASIRVSPVFASYVSNIPGLDYIAKLINYDKGLTSAVENNFVQHVNISQEHDGLVFTIKDMIIDDSKAVIFYSIENKSNHRYVDLKSMEFKDDSGKHLTASINWSGIINKDLSKEKKINEKLDLDFVNGTSIPDNMNINVTLKEYENSDYTNSKALPYVWSFKVPVDKKKFEGMKKIYSLNKTIEVEGQKVKFKTITITPIKAALEVEYDASNTKKMFAFDDLALVDEKGEKWGVINNGISGSRIDDNHEIIYFQSNYFRAPKSLYLTGSSIRALDKDKLLVKVDLNKKILLSSPDDNLILTNTDIHNNVLSLGFSLRKSSPIDKNRGYEIFAGNLKDSATHTYGISASDFSTGGIAPTFNYSFKVDDKLKSPVYLTLNDYPERIKGDFKILIK